MTAHLPPTMRAVVLTGHGGLDKLAYREDWPTPRPGPGEVVVKVGACGLNNTDINTRTAWYSKTVTEGITDAGGKGGYAKADAATGSWSNTALTFPRIQGADTAGRILLDVSSAVGLPGAGQTERITATWKEFAQRFTGTVLPRGLTVSLGGAGRASDAGSVLTRWLPVDGATLYLAGLIAGVLGWQRLRRWWTRLWPPEDRREYGSATGYWTAGLVREAIFAAVFVPTAGVPALAVTLANAVRSGWQAFRGARPLSD